MKEIWGSKISLDCPFEACLHTSVEYVPIFNLLGVLADQHLNCSFRRESLAVQKCYSYDQLLMQGYSLWSGGPVGSPRLGSTLFQGLKYNQKDVGCQLHPNTVVSLVV